VALVAATAMVALASTGFVTAGTGPPPTPVPPHGSLSPFPSVLATPKDQAATPDISASAAVLADLDSGRLMYAKASDAARSIASLTKIMTALLVLEDGHLDAMVTIPEVAVFEPGAYGASSTAGLRAGERLTVRDLLYAMLLGSANDAAVALAIHEAGSIEAFVEQMNARADRLGMRGTRFLSPNGLDDRDRSTARDLVTLTLAAYDTAGFAPIVATKQRTIPGPGDTSRRIQNRNVLLWLYPGAIGAKTGSTAAAGYCLVATAARDGRRLVAIVLGAPADAFSDAATLMNYGFGAFEMHTFVHLGDPLGEVAIRGGTIPVVAGGTIEGLVPTDAVAGARRAVTVDPRAAFPTAPGQAVGTLRVTIPGLTVGTVSLLADALPTPTPVDDAPWWVRAADTVGSAVAQAVGGLMP
jgi:D-alanyl-D-alanine carboxypeptidase (penicillin-binding protein 5/6)